MSAAGLALDEIYGARHGVAYLSAVEVHSGVVWATSGLVEVDGESWTRLVWEFEAQGVRWQTGMSDGGRAIGEAVATAAPGRQHQRDVWHLLHLCQQIQARLARLVAKLEQQGVTVARQDVRLAAGQRAMGKCPHTDIAAHAAALAQARYASEGLRYLSGEFQHLLGVVVLTDRGVMPLGVRQGEVEAALSLLEELSQAASASMQHDLRRVATLLRAALPHLMCFATSLEAVQAQAVQVLGAEALHLLGWAWQRRAILGPPSTLRESVSAEWQASAAPVRVGGLGGGGASQQRGRELA